MDRDSGSDTNQAFLIGKQCFSAESPLIIAELGTGHDNDLAKGRELVAAALEAGANCIKFQHVYADEIIHPNTGLVPLPGGSIPLYERFRRLSCGPDFLADMKERVERQGGLFLCTPFGLRSARELHQLGVQAMKVASPELNHLPMLEELAGYGLPTILSSGVSLLSDIETALDFFSEGQTALLHCVTAYPAPAEDYNLQLLPLLSRLFGIALGVSDHSMDPLLVPALSILQDACIIEKHICLSRKDKGLDDPIALEPADFAHMVTTVRSLAAMNPDSALAELQDRYSPETVAAVLGRGRKVLAPSEAANYQRTRRSIHALRGIAAGEPLSSENTALLRTEKVLRPGLPPQFWKLILNKKAARDIPDGEGIEWQDVGC
ncbi:MAG: N-acetylneuraminate synthase family protein [Spirochaetes bacterium]|nr:N-acetylneuraminate synthase family protein [Spirochaetota bacterium]